MNIINAGNPSANNMIVRQVMQKNRQSSATIFDKLNKRTAKLTAKNPLNNTLTNDQLFRYYIQEVEPKLSQSNDNFSGLPNTTPPDNSIKDTTEKSFGNGKDDYNAGFSGNGVPGMLNSNDITQPRTLTDEEKAIRDYPLVAEVYFLQEQQGDQAAWDILSDWYFKDRNRYHAYVDQSSRMTSVSFEEVDQLIHENIFSKAPYPLPMSDELKNARKLVEMAQKRQQDQNDDENVANFDQMQQRLERDHMINARLNRFDIAKEELGFAPDDVEEFVDELYYGVDELDDGEEDEPTQAGGPRITFYTQEDKNLRFSPVRQYLDGVSFSQPPPSQLFNLFQPNVAAGGPPPASRVSDSHVPKEVVVAGGAEKREKKKRAPPGTHSRTMPAEPDFRAGDIIGNQIIPTTPPISKRTRSKKKAPVLLP
jgi:hypothetical protein